jgi:uncharacterized protein YndB with AHSA1/START domain
VARARNPVRAEIEVDAPIERVWQILTDFERYRAWNPFTPRVETSLRIGDPIHLHVRLRGKRLMHRVETITRNQPYTLGWQMKMGARFLLRAERIQTLTPIDAHRTHYVTEDRFRGWLAPLVLALYGGAMERGFGDCALGLKKAAESRGPEGAGQGRQDP